MVAVAAAMLLAGAAGGSPVAAAGSATPSTTTLDPSHGGKDSKFEVAAPEIVPVIGGAALPRPRCTRHDIDATATTRPTPDGVVGVVSVRGHNCSLRAGRAPVAILAASGNPLDVPIQDSAPIDTGATARPDLAFANGNVAWGFAWRGSWCGAKADAVTVTLKGLGTFRAALRGPSPSCAGQTNATVIKGLSGYPGESLQTAPPEWDALKATLTTSAMTDGHLMTGMSLALSNPTGQPISLAPCPVYEIAVSNSRGDENSADRTLSCPAQPRVVPANGSVTIPLDDLAYAGSDPTTPGSTVTIRLAMAGIPVQTAHSTVAAQPAGAARDPSHGGTDPAFEVAAPQIGPPAHGPAPSPAPPCDPANLTATAVTRGTPYGVVGVLTLAVHGSPCEAWSPGVTTLLDQTGTPLTVSRIADPDRVNPSLAGRDANRLTNGTSFGFAWRGSWCGPPAAAVTLPLTISGSGSNPSTTRATLRAPLSGSMPACNGQSNAALVPGVENAAGQPVQTAPAEWTGIHAYVAAHLARHRAGGIRLDVQLLNTSAESVYLSPCPNFAISVATIGHSSHDPRGVREYVGRSGVRCPDHPRIFASSGGIEFAVKARYDTAHLPIRGTKITVKFAIAGVPTATAHVRAR